MSSEESQTNHPPVPPTDSTLLAEHEKTVGTTVIEREPQSTSCPQCDGRVEYVERQTGRVIIDMWDPEQFDSDEYDLTAERNQIERFNRCKDCGWRIEV